MEVAAAEGQLEQALAYAEKLVENSSDSDKKTLRALRRGDLLARAGRQDETYAAALALVGEGSWLEREVLAQIDKA